MRWRIRKHIEKGHREFERHNYGNALRHYQRVIEAGHFDAHVYLNAGAVLQRMVRYAEAEYLYSAMFDMPEHRSVAHLYCGNSYHERSMYLEAIWHYAKVINSDGKKSAALMGRAKCNFALGRIDLALSDVERLQNGDIGERIMAKEMREIIDGRAPNSVYRGMT